MIKQGAAIPEVIPGNTPDLLSGILSGSLDGIMALRAVRADDREIVDFEWLLANAKAENIEGRAEGELEGRRLLHEMPSSREEGLFDAYVGVVETGEPFEHEFYCDREGIRAWFKRTAVKLEDGFVVTFRDISQHKQADKIGRLNRLLVEGVTEYAIFMIDPDGRIKSWNAGAERIKGYGREEVLGRHFAMFYTEEDVERGHPQEELRLAREQQQYEEEGWRVRKDGSRFWASVVITALWDEEGGLQGYAKVSRDLTERKQAEEELQKASDSLETRGEQRNLELTRSNEELEEQIAKRKRTEAERNRFFELSQDMLCIATFEGYFVSLNPAWEKALGYAPEELTSQPFLDFVHPDDRAATIEVFAGLAEGVPAVAFEHRYRCKDGSYIWIAWAATTGKEEGLVYAVARDVTEHKRFQEALQESARRLNEAQRVARVGDWYWDVSDNRIAWSEGLYRLYGWEPGTFEMTFERAADCVHPHDRVANLERTQKALSGEEPYVSEYRAIRADGSTFVLRSQGEVERNEIGEPVRMFGVTQDITERKTAERELDWLNESLRVRNAELAHKNEEIESFVYSVSHDLRSPLVNLEGFSQEVQTVAQEIREAIEGAEVSPQIRREVLALIDDDMATSVRFIRAAVGRLSVIIDALLRFSRVGNIEYRWVQVDLNPLVGRIVDSMQDTISARGASIEVAELPPVWGDPTALEQVFANLIDNAFKYLDPKRTGRVEVGYKQGRKAADGSAFNTYYVKDNGLGIPHTAMNKVFQIFQRLHPGTEGEGVGLAFTQRVVQRHGGRIWVESEAGAGSTFFLEFPAEPDNAGHERDEQ